MLVSQPQGGPLRGGTGRPILIRTRRAYLGNMKKPRPPQKPPGRHRRALVLLASCPDGCTESVMQAHGFTIEQIAELIRAGLATREVTRVKITEAGQRELAG